MLNPIKTFFNYLQNKNANSSNNFKISNELNMTDEANASPDGVEGGSFEDPLTDPLAIDEDFPTASESIIGIPSAAESAQIENIIFVDIEKLKCKVKDNDGLESKESESSQESDINGNNRSSIEIKGSIETIKDVDNEQINATESSSVNEKVRSDKPESEKPDENLKAAENSFVTSVNSSEPEIDEVDTSVLLEERSDGSDSGLGSESLRSISAIEKNLATLTPSKSSLKRRSVDNLHDEQPKKPKRGINFGDVTVFYFPRCQGFGCVPTQGGSTLGMTAKHAYKKSFTLTEHAIEQRRLYRLKMAGNDLNESSSSSDESKSDDEISENSLSEGDNEAYGFLQPVTTRQRRALLKAAGVRKIDTVEKDECRELRTSREVCGCTCRGYCDPETCECSQAGIKCQVDRLKPHEFPCGCTRDGCDNVNGRIEFNPARVKTHFIHTIMRLELEKRHEMSEDATTTVIQNHSKWWTQMRMQQPQPAQATTSCNYNYAYNSSAPAPQYSAKIPPISTMVSPSINGQESLDLHYAYRDDYINNPNSLSLSADGVSSFQSSTNGSDYYSNYNYLSPSSTSVYQNGYHQTIHHAQQQHQESHVPYQSQLPQSTFSGDCQYSNYTPTNSPNRYHTRTDPPTVDVNGVRTNNFVNSYEQVESAVNHTRGSYQSPHHPSSHEIATPIESFPAISASAASSTNSAITTVTNNNNCLEDSATPTEGDTSENLSEIIKKSIVETVTA